MRYKIIWKNKSNHRMFNDMEIKTPKMWNSKSFNRKIIAQKLRRLVDQSMTAGIHLQSMERAGETLYNHSARDHKASTNGYWLKTAVHNLEHQFQWGSGWSTAVVLFCEVYQTSLNKVPMAWKTWSSGICLCISSLPVETLMWKLLSSSCKKVIHKWAVLSSQREAPTNTVEVVLEQKEKGQGTVWAAKFKWELQVSLRYLLTIVLRNSFPLLYQKAENQDFVSDQSPFLLLREQQRKKLHVSPERYILIYGYKGRKKLSELLIFEIHFTVWAS